jgi:hypothetical protein
MCILYRERLRSISDGGNTGGDIVSFSWDELDQLQPKQVWRVPIPPTCSRCHYILHGLRSNQCPECGTPIRWKEVRRRAARTWTLVLRLRHANQDAKLGIILGSAGWVLLLIVRLAGWRVMDIIVDPPVFVGAVLAAVLGTQVLNIRRVPSYAREFLGDVQPRITLGLVAMFLGLSLLVGMFVLW